VHTQGRVCERQSLSCGFVAREDCWVLYSARSIRRWRPLVSFPALRHERWGGQLYQSELAGIIALKITVNLLLKDLGAWECQQLSHAVKYVKSRAEHVTHAHTHTLDRWSCWADSAGFPLGIESTQLRRYFLISQPQLKTAVGLGVKRKSAHERGRESEKANKR